MFAQKWILIAEPIEEWKTKLCSSNNSTFPYTTQNCMVPQRPGNIESL